MMSVCLGGPWGSGAVRYPTPSLASNALRGGFHLFSDLSVDFSGITVTAITALSTPEAPAPGPWHQAPSSSPSGHSVYPGHFPSFQGCPPAILRLIRGQLAA